MRSSTLLRKHWQAWGARALVAVGFVALVGVLLLWLAGRFSPKLPATTGGAPEQPTDGAVTSWTSARLVRLPVTETAVGSVRAAHESAIASRLAARVVEVKLKAGQQVKAGDVLVRLDDSDLRARLEQAQAGVEHATAVRDNAATEQRRAANLYKQNAASANEYERADTALKAAEAELARAEEAVKEAQSLLEYATVKAPIDGVVVDKKVDLGDTVLPGQVMATVYDHTTMQLVASVRESLAYRLQVGQEIGVRLDVLDKTCAGRVSEIVPEAESASRTFQVKVTGPCPPGIYTGMFGRILIPLDEEEVLLVPQAAVRRIGQLELVEVAETTGAGAVTVQRRAVRTGRVIDGQVEVLSGLRAGEMLVVPQQLPSPKRPPTANADARQGA